MKKVKVFRRIIQIVFFVLIALIAVNHTLSETGRGIPVLSDASLHAVCPFGGVVTLYQVVTEGSFVRKIHASSLILMIIVFLSAVILGPVFCGWICPFGTFQEWIASIGKKLFKKRYNRMIPAVVHRWLGYFRYLVLFWVLYVTARSGQLLFANIDPYYALFHFWTGEVAVSGLIALGLVVLASLFIERPFCKYACPYGAFLGLTNLFRMFPLRRNPKTCISCKACDKACPMNIPVSISGTVRNHHCISCYKCTSGDGACPVEKTLEFRNDRFEEVAK